MFLFVGLGNPGAAYAGNRHNVGFMAMDMIAQARDFGAWRKRFSGMVSEGYVGHDRLFLLKPQTFMNESGRAVVEAVKFLNIALDRVFVFHDELDLPFATLRVKHSGGHAGHNGLRSISQHISPDYSRVRFGIGKPTVRDLVHAYVLSDFSKSERPIVTIILEKIVQTLPQLIAGRDGEFQNNLREIAKDYGDGI